MQEPELAKLASAYDSAAGLLRDALTQSDQEFLALRKGKQPERDAPAGIVYTTEQALLAFMKLRAHVQELVTC